MEGQGEWRGQKGICYMTRMLGNMFGKIFLDVITRGGWGLQRDDNPPILWMGIQSQNSPQTLFQIPDTLPTSPRPTTSPILLASLQLFPYNYPRPIFQAPPFLVILKRMIPISNPKKQRKQFRVKFTGSERQKSTPISKSMILGGRQRNTRDYPADRDPNQPTEREVDDELELEDDCNTSKRELQLKSVTPKHVEYAHINTSNIINGGLQPLTAFFDYQVSLKLIFRASNHNFSVKDFHEICDAYEDTLTLCLTEDNKIIGGYTPLSWEDQFQRNSTHFKTDFKRETFLFSVTDNAKYPLVKSLKNKAICCFKSYGPTFGGGYDLLIGDKTNQLPNTTSYFPRNFQHPNGANFNKRDFTGTSRKNFKLIQWEVYHVIKLHSLKTVENLNFAHISNTSEIKVERSLWDRFKSTVKDVVNTLCSDN